MGGVESVISLRKPGTVLSESSAVGLPGGGRRRGVGWEAMFEEGCTTPAVRYAPGEVGT